MFNIGWSEFLLIGIVALVAIGPKELPGVLRMAGQWIGRARRMAAEFQGQFQEALREAEMVETRKEIEETFKSAESTTSGLLTDGTEVKAAADTAAPASGSSEFEIVPAPLGTHPSWTENAPAAPAATDLSELADIADGTAAPIEQPLASHEPSADKTDDPPAPSGEKAAG